MSFDPSPRAIVAVAFGVFLAVFVGANVSSIRNAIVYDYGGGCIDAGAMVFGQGFGAELAGPGSECFAAVFTFIVVPGMVTFFLIGYAAINGD